MLLSSYGRHSTISSCILQTVWLCDPHLKKKNAKEYMCFRNEENNPYNEQERVWCTITQANEEKYSMSRRISVLVNCYLKWLFLIWTKSVVLMIQNVIKAKIDRFVVQWDGLEQCWARHHTRKSVNKLRRVVYCEHKRAGIEGVGKGVYAGIIDVVGRGYPKVVKMHRMQQISSVVNSWVWEAFSDPYDHCGFAKKYENWVDINLQ